MPIQKLKRQALPCETRIDFTGQPVQPPPSNFSLPFVVELDLGLSILDPGPGQNQKFCYRKTGVGEDNNNFRDLSHEVFRICEDITEDQIVNIQVFINGEEQDVNFGEGGNVELRTQDNPDPPTGCPGLKFDFGLSKVEGGPGSTMLVCFELTQEYPVGPIEVCEFGGGKTARGLTICGPVCEGVNLDITKNCPIGDFTEGDQVTIDLVLSNTGSETANNVIVTDEIEVPAGVIIDNVQTNFPAAISPATGPYIGFTIVTITSQDLGPLAPGDILNLQVTFTIVSVSVASSITDTATVTGNSSSDTDDCEVSIVPPSAPIVRIDKNCPSGLFGEGDNIAVDLVVTNTGSVTANNVIVTDEIEVPAGVIIDNVQTNFLAAISPPTGPYVGLTTVTITSEDLGPLAPGAALDLQVTFDIISVSAAGSITDTATVTGNGSSDTDSCEVSVVVAPPPPPPQPPVRGIKAVNFMALLGKID